MGFFCQDSSGRKFYYNLAWNHFPKSDTDWLLRHYAGEDLICEMLCDGSCTVYESRLYKGPYRVEP